MEDEGASPCCHCSKSGRSLLRELRDEVRQLRQQVQGLQEQVQQQNETMQVLAARPTVAIHTVPVVIAPADASGAGPCIALHCSTPGMSPAADAHLQHVATNLNNVQAFYSPAPTSVPTPVPTSAPTCVPTSAPTSVPPFAHTSVPAPAPPSAPTSIPISSPVCLPGSFAFHVAQPASAARPPSGKRGAHTGDSGDNGAMPSPVSFGAKHGGLSQQELAQKLSQRAAAAATQQRPPARPGHPTEQQDLPAGPSSLRAALNKQMERRRLRTQATSARSGGTVMSSPGAQPARSSSRGPAPHATSVHTTSHGRLNHPAKQALAAAAAAAVSSLSGRHTSRKTGSKRHRCEEEGSEEDGGVDGRPVSVAKAASGGVREGQAESQGIPARHPAKRQRKGEEREGETTGRREGVEVNRGSKGEASGGRERETTGRVEREVTGGRNGALSAGNQQETVGRREGDITGDGEGVTTGRREGEMAGDREGPVAGKKGGEMTGGSLGERRGSKDTTNGVTDSMKSKRNKRSPEQAGIGVDSVQGVTSVGGGRMAGSSSHQTRRTDDKRKASSSDPSEGALKQKSSPKMNGVHTSHIGASGSLTTSQPAGPSTSGQGGKTTSNTSQETRKHKGASDPAAVHTSQQQHAGQGGRQVDMAAVKAASVRNAVHPQTLVNPTSLEALEQSLLARGTHSRPTTTVANDAGTDSKEERQVKKRRKDKGNGAETDATTGVTNHTEDVTYSTGDGHRQRMLSGQADGDVACGGGLVGEAEGVGNRQGGLGVGADAVGDGTVEVDASDAAGSLGNATEGVVVAMAMVGHLVTTIDVDSVRTTPVDNAGPAPPSTAPAHDPSQHQQAAAVSEEDLTQPSPSPSNNPQPSVDPKGTGVTTGNIDTTASDEVTQRARHGHPSQRPSQHPSQQPQVVDSVLPAQAATGDGLGQTGVDGGKEVVGPGTGRSVPGSEGNKDEGSDSEESEGEESGSEDEGEDGEVEEKVQEEKGKGQSVQKEKKADVGSSSRESDHDSDDESDSESEDDDIDDHVDDSKGEGAVGQNAAGPSGTEKESVVLVHTLMGSSEPEFIPESEPQNEDQEAAAVGMNGPVEKAAEKKVNESSDDSDESEDDSDESEDSESEEDDEDGNGEGEEADHSTGVKGKNSTGVSHFVTPAPVTAIPFAAPVVQADDAPGARHEAKKSDANRSGAKKSDANKSDAKKSDVKTSDAKTGDTGKNESDEASKEESSEEESEESSSSSSDSDEESSDESEMIGTQRPPKQQGAAVKAAAVQPENQEGAKKNGNEGGSGSEDESGSDEESGSGSDEESESESGSEEEDKQASQVQPTAVVNHNRAGQEKAQSGSESDSESESESGSEDEEESGSESGESESGSESSSSEESSSEEEVEQGQTKGTAGGAVGAGTVSKDLVDRDGIRYSLEDPKALRLLMQKSQSSQPFPFTPLSQVPIVPTQASQHIAARAGPSTAPPATPRGSAAVNGGITGQPSGSKPSASKPLTKSALKANNVAGGTKQKGQTPGSKEPKGQAGPKGRGAQGKEPPELPGDAAVLRAQPATMVQQYVRRRFIDWANSVRLARNLKPANICRFPDGLQPDWWPPHVPFSSAGLSSMDKSSLIDLYGLLTKNTLPRQ